MKTVFASLSVALALAFATSAHATPTAYSTPGIQNKQAYTFTAQNTGDITAYFAGSDAAYTNELTLLVNGVATNILGLNTHASGYGAMINFGSVNAGDVLVFEMVNITPGDTGPWYSTMALNNDGMQHIYSASYAGDNLIPAGTLVGFEDLAGGGDFDYNDENFVFTNVATAVNVPEPGSLALLGLGLAGVGFCRRRARAK